MEHPQLLVPPKARDKAERGDDGETGRALERQGALVLEGSIALGRGHVSAEWQIEGGSE